MHQQWTGNGPLQRLLRPLIRVNCIAVLLIGVLMVICTGTMLAVTVPASLHAADHFARNFGEATTLAAREHVDSLLLVQVRSYRNVLHGAATGVLPDFTLKTNLVERRQDMLRWRDALRQGLMATGMRVSALSAGFTDRSFINCVVWNRNIGLHSCWVIDYKNSTWAAGWREDYIWEGPYVNLTAYKAARRGHNHDPRTEAWYRDAPRSPTAHPQLSDTYLHLEYRHTVLELAMPLFNHSVLSPIHRNALLPSTTVPVPAPALSSVASFIGVVAVTRSSFDLSWALTTLTRAGNRLFLLDEQRLLLADSKINPSISQVNALWTSEWINTTTYNFTANPPNASQTFVAWESKLYTRFSPENHPNCGALRALARMHPEWIYAAKNSNNTKNNQTVGVHATASTASAETGIFTTVDNAHDPNSQSKGDLSTRRLLLDGTVFYVTVALLGPHSVPISNLNYLMISFLPEANIIGEITSGYQNALHNAAVALGCCFFLSAVFAWLLLYPLGTLTHQMQNALTLHDDRLPTRGRTSIFREIRAIQRTFYELCSLLKKTKVFLPPATIDALVRMAVVVPMTQRDENEDDDDEGDLNHTMTLSCVSRTNSACASPAAGGLDDDSSGGDCDGASLATMMANSCREREGDGTDDRGDDDGAGRTLYGIGRQRGDSCGEPKTNHRSMSPRAQPPSLLTDTSIGRRTISVLALNCLEFHRGVRHAPSIALGSRYGMLVAAVAEAVGSQRGVVDSFHGDRFFATFNAVKPVGSHAAAAALAGLNIADAGAGGVRAVSAGVATGPAYVGNMGHPTQKRFMAVGAVTTQAAVLERLCRALPPSRGRVLLEAHAANDAEMAIDVLHVGLVRLPTACDVSATASLSRLSAAKGPRLQPFLMTSPLSAWLFSNEVDDLLDDDSMVRRLSHEKGIDTATADPSCVQDLQLQSEQLVTTTTTTTSTAAAAAAVSTVTIMRLLNRAFGHCRDGEAEAVAACLRRIREASPSVLSTEGTAPLQPSPPPPSSPCRAMGGGRHNPTTASPHRGQSIPTPPLPPSPTTSTGESPVEQHQHAAVEMQLFCPDDLLRDARENGADDEPEVDADTVDNSEGFDALNGVPATQAMNDPAAAACSHSTRSCQADDDDVINGGEEGEKQTEGEEEEEGRHTPLAPPCMLSACPVSADLDVPCSPLHGHMLEYQPNDEQHHDDGGRGRSLPVEPPTAVPTIFPTPTGAMKEKDETKQFVEPVEEKEQTPEEKDEEADEEGKHDDAFYLLKRHREAETAADIRFVIARLEQWLQYYNSHEVFSTRGGSHSVSGVSSVAVSPRERTTGDCEEHVPATASSTAITTAAASATPATTMTNTYSAAVLVGFNNVEGIKEHDETVKNSRHIKYSGKRRSVTYTRDSTHTHSSRSSSSSTRRTDSHAVEDDESYDDSCGDGCASHPFYSHFNNNNNNKNNRTNTRRSHRRGTATSARSVVFWSDDVETLATSKRTSNVVEHQQHQQQQREQSDKEEEEEEEEAEVAAAKQSAVVADVEGLVRSKHLSSQKDHHPHHHHYRSSASGGTAGSGSGPGGGGTVVALSPTSTPFGGASHRSSSSSSSSYLHPRPIPPAAVKKVAPITTTTTTTSVERTREEEEEEEEEEEREEEKQREVPLASRRDATAAKRNYSASHFLNDDSSLSDAPPPPPPPLGKKLASSAEMAVVSGQQARTSCSSAPRARQRNPLQICTDDFYGRCVLGWSPADVPFGGNKYAER